MTIDKLRNRCFLDIEVEGENGGRIVVELFSDVCPITCENFRALCTGEKGLSKSGLALHYKGATFHRIVKGFMIQGGDFAAGNGTGGESIYGGQFKDENFELSHETPFLLSMANRGKDSNGSQFFITTRPAPHLDGRNTVFGRVIAGEEVVSEIENLPIDQNCTPSKAVNIINCGELVPSLKKKKRRKSLSESMSGSESGEMKEREKRKKKRSKHSKKHKKEKERRAPDARSFEKEDDFGCHVNPEEIPTIPVNNFLLRRASPVGDTRRIPLREPYKFKPVKSRSGRNLKGRGFMRYRTPSRSRSRSRSETPPHWKQAQSRLKKIEEVLPLKQATPSEDSQHSAQEEEEVGLEIVPRANLQSRLGKVHRDHDNKPRDARSSIRESRRNREWSPEPTRNQRDNYDRVRSTEESRSTMRSMVTVTPNFIKEPNDKNQDRNVQNRIYRRGRRSISPERRFPERHTEYNSRNRHGNQRSVPEVHSKKEVEKQKPTKKPSSLKDSKRLKSLTHDLFRYRKDAESSDESGDNKNKELPKNDDHKKTNTSKSAAKIKKENHSDKPRASEDRDNTRKDVSYKTKERKSSLEEPCKTEIFLKKDAIPFITDPDANQQSEPVDTRERSPSPKSRGRPQTMVKIKVEPGIEPPLAKTKEKRRWDVQSGGKTDAVSLGYLMPNIIPLPEEASAQHSVFEEEELDQENSLLEKRRELLKQQIKLMELEEMVHPVDTEEEETPATIQKIKYSRSRSNSRESQSALLRNRSHSRSFSPVERRVSKSPLKLPVIRRNTSPRKKARSSSKSLSPTRRKASMSPNRKVRSFRSDTKSPVKVTSSKTTEKKFQSLSKSPPKKLQRSHSASKSPIKKKSKSPIKKTRRSRSTSKSPVLRKSKSPNLKTRKSRSKSPRLKSSRNRSARSRSNSRSVSRRRYDRNSRRSPSPRRSRYGRSRSNTRRDTYTRRPIDRRPRRSRSPVRRNRSRTSSSGSSSSGASSSSGRRTTKKGGKKRRTSSSSSSSSGSAST